MVILIIGAIVLFVVVLFWLIFKPYFVRNNTINLFTGSNGSGKTFFAVRQSIILLRKNRMKTWFHNLFERMKFWKKEKDFWEKPILYSNIPVRISKNEWSTLITKEHLLLQDKMCLRSVILLDEINLIASQMSYALKSEKALNYWCTLIRHFLKGPYVVMTTQNSSKIHWIFRYCVNDCYNLSDFRKPILGLPIIAFAKCRRIMLSEDIKSVDYDFDEQTENLFAFFPIRKYYDTYCYSNMYNTLDESEELTFTDYKTYHFATIDPSVKVDPKIEID